jgi:hypothetical protein
MVNEIQREVLATHTFISDWYTSSPPNGCLEVVERRHEIVTVYKADYYGKGAKLYSEGYFKIETQTGGIGPRYGSWADGNVERAEELLRKIQTTMQEAK